MRFYRQLSEQDSYHIEASQPCKDSLLLLEQKNVVSFLDLVEYIEMYEVKEQLFESNKREYEG